MLAPLTLRWFAQIIYLKQTPFTPNDRAKQTSGTFMNSNVSLLLYTFANRSLLFADELTMAWKKTLKPSAWVKGGTCCDHLIVFTMTVDHATIFLTSFPLNLT